MAEDRKWSRVWRRDFRHTHGEPEEPPHRKKRRKNTRKRFCGGRYDRPHTFVFRHGGKYWLDYFECDNCGRKEWAGRFFEFFRNLMPQ